MQYSALLALSSALMAAGVASERVAIPYGMNPAQAAAMGSAMNAPWAVPPPSAAPQSSMVSMHSSMKHAKATIIPGMANSAMAFPSMASPAFPSMPAMATPSPSSRGSNGSSRNGPNHKHGVHHAHDSFRAPQGGTHGVEQSSDGWHDADGLSQGSNGVGNTAGMGQEASNESQGSEDLTPDQEPQLPGPPPAQQPQEDQSPEHPTQEQQPSPAPQPQPQEEVETDQAPDQDKPAQAPRPPANDAPASTTHGGKDASSEPPHGGLAPVSPMQPGSNVAPMGFDHTTHGQDIGNAFCLGQCYPSEEAAKCGEPYSSAMWKKELGCYTCCFTAPDI